jgi:hypothetical protein
MSTNKKLAAFVAGFALVVGPMAGAAAETRTYHRHIVKKPQYRPVRVASDSGWRHRIGKGWDNTCHNLPYLINMYACDAK